MFFHHRFYEKTSGADLAFTPETILYTNDLAADAYLRSTFARETAFVKTSPDRTVIRTLTLSKTIPDDILAKVSGVRPTAGDSEEYAVVLGEDSFVYAFTERGLLCGFATVLQMLDHDELSPALLYDYPVCPVRGYRVYLPARAQFDDFYKMVDMLVYYKYNSIILEIGGAMEYHRHPEINRVWADFCADMHRYSGRSMEVQHAYPWEKNSIHCDNGGGDILTQDECATLAAYCRERGLDVIPECPTLSHSDYLVMAHPELREREEDPYPDTYCPLHPDTYPLVFDVLDEVIDVFRPTMVNIGHDELYTIGLCPRCKDHDPVDLYVMDVTKLRDYLAERGIGVYMWGEKLLKACTSDGTKVGGWNDGGERNGIRYRWPDLYPCAEKMPSGVTFLHWYWCFGEHLDRVYHDHGYPMVFSNFNALGSRKYNGCPGFKKRLSWGCKGGFVSNWGSNEDEYLQRNFQYFDLIGTAYAFWCDDYDTDMERQPYFVDRAIREGFRRRVKNTANPLFVTHTTEGYIPHEYFYDGIFIEDEVYLLGHYEIYYTDGTTARFPVKYGTNITTESIDDIVTSETYQEMCGGTLPIALGNGKYAYTCVYENPKPGVGICGFRYVPVDGKEDFVVKVKSVDFGGIGDVKTEAVREVSGASGVIGFTRD